jgi:hypothetical protein
MQASKIEGPEKSRRLALPGGSLAVGAKAVQHNFVPANRKARFGESIHVGHTAVQFKDTGASVTSKMMVVALPRFLIDGGLTRQFNWNQPTLFNHRFDVPVNGGKAQAIDFRLSGIQNLLGRQWAPGPLESSANRCSLAGVTLRVDRHCSHNDSLVSTIGVA